jgi:hypothetical protein
LTTTTLVAADPPKETVAPDTKFVPVIVTGVPPPNGPETGATADTVGAATYVNWSLTDVADVPAELVTVTSTTPAA